MQLMNVTGWRTVYLTDNLREGPGVIVTIF
jgi:hypothetical protein